VASTSLTSRRCIPGPDRESKRILAGRRGSCYGPANAKGRHAAHDWDVQQPEMTRAASAEQSSPGVSPCRPQALVMLGLFLITLSIFLLTTYARGYSTDGSQYFYTAEAFLEGRLSIKKENSLGARLAADGNFYSKAGPFQSVVEIPAILVSGALGSVLPLDGPTRSEMVRGWAPDVTSALTVSGIVVLVCLIVLELGYGLASAGVIGTLVALTTPHWIYARVDFTEPTHSFLLLAAFLTLLRARRAPSSAGPAILIGTMVGALILTKLSYLLVVPVFWLALLWLGRPLTSGKFFQLSLACGVPIALGGLTYLAWNYARWGSILDFGFQSEPFDTPLIIGLYGLFLSPGKSVFLYAPILMLAAVGLVPFARRHPFETIVIAALTIPGVFFYAKFWSWSGDWAWGPRYMVAFMALWALPVATMLASGRIIHRVALSVLALGGLWVQICGVAINPGNYLSIHMYQVVPVVFPGMTPNFKASRDMVHFNPFFSPIVAHWWLLKASVERIIWPEANDPEKNTSLQDRPWKYIAVEGDWKPAHPEYALGPDVWPYDPPKYMTRTAVVTVAGVFTLIGVAGFAALGAGIRTGSRSRRAAK